MWVLWLVGSLALGVAVWALLRASPRMENPGRHRLMVLGAAAAFVLAFVGPPVWRTLRNDFWGSIGTVAVAAIIGAVVLAYAKLIRRARERSRERD